MSYLTEYRLGTVTAMYMATPAVTVKVVATPPGSKLPILLAASARGGNLNCLRRLGDAHDHYQKYVLADDYAVAYRAGLLVNLGPRDRSLIRLR